MKSAFSTAFTDFIYKMEEDIKEAKPPLSVVYDRELDDERLERWRLAYEQVCHPIAQEVVETKKRGVRVLDIGCWTGHYAYTIIFEEAQTIFLDISPHFIERTERKIEEVPQATVLQANAEALPFPNEDFDVVIILGLLEHLEEEKFKRVLTEAARVGKTVIVDIPNKEARQDLKMFGDVAREEASGKKPIEELTLQQIEERLNGVGLKVTKWYGQMIEAEPGVRIYEPEEIEDPKDKESLSNFGVLIAVCKKDKNLSK